MKKVIEILAFCLAFQASAAALEITSVSPVAVKGAAAADLTFSVLTVKGVTYEKGAVVMPVTENKGKIFTDVKLLSRKLYVKIEACFKNGLVKPAKAPAVPAVKVSAVKPLKSKSRVANAEVTFDGELLVVVGVMASSKEPGTFWAAFPEVVTFSDPAFKSAVESAAIAAWTKKTK